MRRMAHIVIWAGLAVAPAPGSYWIAYEGNDWPENQGWWHIWYDKQARRSLENGVLTIDSLHDTHIADFYVKPMNGKLDPGPDEWLVLQWRLWTERTINGRDVNVGVFSDEKWAVGFGLDERSIVSAFENGVRAEFEPGAFHDFELRSQDMRNYQLFIDGKLRIAGRFWYSTTESRVLWGDGVQGEASLSHWDYVRFGAVCEPLTAISLMCLAAALPPAARRPSWGRRCAQARVRCESK